MAQSKGNKGLKPSELVEKLTADSTRLTPSRMLTGYLGKTTQEGRWRLYLTPELDESVEFSENDVLHSQTLPDDALERTAVWIKQEASLQYTQTVSAQADFLQGDITSGFLQQATALQGLESENAAIWTIIIRVSMRICPSVKRCPKTNLPTLCNPGNCPAF